MNSALLLLALLWLARSSAQAPPGDGSVARFKGVDLLYSASSDAWSPLIPGSATPWAKGATLTFPGGHVYRWNGARFVR